MIDIYVCTDGLDNSSRSEMSLIEAVYIYGKYKKIILATDALAPGRRPGVIGQYKDAVVPIWPAQLS